MGIDVGGKPKFRVGDRVRVVAVRPVGESQGGYSWVPAMDAVLAEVGKVIDVTGYGVVVEFANGDIWGFRPEWVVDPTDLSVSDPLMPVGGPLVDGGVFEAPDPVPPEPEKRKRVSNQLYAVLADVTRLEGDFAYQYEYNRELVEELAEAKRDAAERVDEARQDRDGWRVSHGHVSATLTRVEERERALRAEVARLRRPNRLWRRVAALGWAAALAVGGVVAAEKISGAPIDKLAELAIIELSNLAD